MEEVIKSAEMLIDEPNMHRLVIGKIHLLGESTDITHLVAVNSDRANLITLR